MIADDFFQRTVLRACTASLGQKAVYNPIRSQSSMPAYVVIGIFTRRPVELVLEDGQFARVYETTLGVNLADFGQPPLQNDKIFVGGEWFLVNDVQRDGQGGASLALKQCNP